MESLLKRHLGYASVRAVGGFMGGDTADSAVYVVQETEGGDTTKMFVKRSSQRDARAMFDGEYASLEAMHNTGCVAVPKPIAVIEDPKGRNVMLVEEYLELRGGLSSRAAKELGGSVANMHLHNESRRGSPEYVSKFGFHIPTHCGQLQQGNKWEDDWPTYHVAKLQEQMDALKRNGGDREAERLWPKLKKVIPTLFEGIEVRPALLHGDLWSGNAGVKEGGQGVIYDPGSFYGHHEYDLGIAGMFGFSSDFMNGYHEVIPKAEGFDQRHKLYQLFHYLNHWNIFGGGYRSSSISIMKKLTGE